MARKTIDVEQVLEWANTRLDSKDSSYFGITELTPEQAFRMGVASFLEQILHDTGQYRGFSYNDGWEAVQAGNYDETRRRYI